jgi:hypothetical protein
MLRQWYSVIESESGGGPNMGTDVFEISSYIALGLAALALILLLERLLKGLTNWFSGHRGWPGGSLASPWSGVAENY